MNFPKFGKNEFVTAKVQLCRKFYKIEPILVYLFENLIAAFEKSKTKNVKIMFLVRFMALSLAISAALFERLLFCGQNVAFPTTTTTTTTTKCTFFPLVGVVVVAVAAVVVVAVICYLCFFVR
jgi:hypothetical protein